MSTNQENKENWVDKSVKGYASLLMIKVNADVMNERIRQNKKWGHQRHNVGAWLAIIGEEWGEVCQAAGPYTGLTSNKPTDANDLYEELMHLAAMASALAEQIREENERGL